MAFWKKKDPVCGMKEEKGKGLLKEGKWFCSQNCASQYEKNTKKQGCCGKSCCH